MTDFIRGAIGSVHDIIFLVAFLTFIILLLLLMKLWITLVTVTIIPGLYRMVNKKNSPPKKEGLS